MIAPRIGGGPAGTDAEVVHPLMTGISRAHAPAEPMPQFRMTQADAKRCWPTSNRYRGIRGHALNRLARGVGSLDPTSLRPPFRGP